MNVGDNTTTSGMLDNRETGKNAERRADIDGNDAQGSGTSRLIKRIVSIRVSTTLTRGASPAEPGGQLTCDGFAKMLAAVGERAGIDRRLCYPRALRHAAGYASANCARVNEYQLQSITSWATAILAALAFRAACCSID